MPGACKGAPLRGKLLGGTGDGCNSVTAEDVRRSQDGAGVVKQGGTTYVYAKRSQNSTERYNGRKRTTTSMWLESSSVRDYLTTHGCDTATRALGLVPLRGRTAANAAVSLILPDRNAPSTGSGCDDPRVFSSNSSAVSRLGEMIIVFEPVLAWSWPSWS